MGRSQVRSNRRLGLLSSTEAAAALGVCERTLRRYIASGRIRCHRLPGGHYRIPQDAITEFWAEHDRLKRAQRSARASARLAVRTPERSAASTRRAALGRERDGEYDLSPAHLAELRARFATTETT
jgi:excisionase family DNA binding protein